MEIVDYNVSKYFVGEDKCVRIKLLKVVGI